MMTELSAEAWDKIRETFDRDPNRYGLPKREYGSVVLASFNIRKLGAKRQRSEATWKFLARVCSHFDLLSVQEIMDDLEGFDYLKSLMGPEFGAVVSDVTGSFPGEKGLGERLGFIFNRSLVERGDIVSDISIDRTKLITTLLEHKDKLQASITPHLDPVTGEVRQGAKIKLPVFLTFIRQPFCASFRVVGHPGTKPYEFMAVNAHLYFGEGVDDRRHEFDALMEWILGRVQEQDKAYYPNFVLMGDLNLDFDDPEQDRVRIAKHIKTLNDAVGNAIDINFPFLDPYPGSKKPFRTNARLSETFDQIGFFSRDQRLPLYQDNVHMGENPRGPDYGVFNFAELFREALGVSPLAALPKPELKEFFAQFEHEVSDHLPLWLRVPLPD
ncbi:endonuclease/exonuclease/phosphatase [Leptolyngbya sp. FACHB-321]|uniref:endonuclease/exonuclease/phosphatase n=1 Tax=Leptolyngbya sp. FACHB-321 TaxID=2692807 RepID=UPI0018EFDCFB|nr:endonuclease/exonuclease/phosphatase [Leptolyngbya sp. FACHB-321]